MADTNKEAPIDPALVRAALDARSNAYAPYSKYHVGAAIRAENGKIYCGVNVENASYPEGTCAEAGAIAAMVLDGQTVIQEVVVAGPVGVIITPCGGCRQRLHEFAAPSTAVHSCDQEGVRQTTTIGELLPYAFSESHLEK